MLFMPWEVKLWRLERCKCSKIQMLKIVCFVLCSVSLWKIKHAIDFSAKTSLYGIFLNSYVGNVKVQTRIRMISAVWVCIFTLIAILVLKNVPRWLLKVQSTNWIYAKLLHRIATGPQIFWNLTGRSPMLTQGDYAKFLCEPAVKPQKNIPMMFWEGLSLPSSQFWG